MENANLKVFKVTGKYKMSEDDNFKTAKSISLSSALQILNDEVQNFLRDNFKNLDDDDIFEIIKKFVKTDEPRFVRENLPDNEMFCYAYVDAEINLDDLNNFLKNFDVCKLEKKIGEMQKTIDELNSKFELYQKFLSEVIAAEIDIKKKISPSTYIKRGIAYEKLQNYEQAISDCTNAIKLDSKNYWAYNNRGYYNYILGNYSQAIEDLNRAIKLDPKDTHAYVNRGYCHGEIGEIEKAERDFTKAHQLGWEG